MGVVIKLQPRPAGKTTQLLIDALAYEQDPNSEGNAIIVAVPDLIARAAMRRQLLCMVGSKSTRIEVLTVAEIKARNRAKAKEMLDGNV